MNFKFLFPTFVNRYIFVETSLAAIGHVNRILHIGTGEGDYDPLLARHSDHLISCDHNESDLAFARRRNQDLSNVQYSRQDTLALRFDDSCFDIVVAVEVIEHVSDPLQMLREMCRVLKPGGHVILTYPRFEFPWTYDPINRLLTAIGATHLPIGAYSFGHTTLFRQQHFLRWVDQTSLIVDVSQPLSGYLVGLVEAYWTGVAQLLFKTNASNEAGITKSRRLARRPGNRIPMLEKPAMLISIIDDRFFAAKDRSVGLGYVLKRTSIP